MRILVLMTACVLLSAPADSAPYWNVTPGPVTYVHTRGGSYETDVSAFGGPGANHQWHYFSQGPYGYSEENYRVRVDGGGNVFVEHISCGTDAGGFDEGWSFDYDRYGEHMIAPAAPELGLSWQWPESEFFWQGPPTFTVVAYESVAIGRKDVMAWRVDIETDGLPGDWGGCNSATLPVFVESYWLAESLGVVKWVIFEGNEVVMDDAPNVVPNEGASWGTLKSRFRARK